MPRRTRRPSSAVTQPSVASISGEQAATISVSGPQRPRAKGDPLVGKFFHSFYPEATYPDAPTPIVKWQGHVLGRVNEQTYLIELFSWMTGEPDAQRLQPIADMADWMFYPTANAMSDWYCDIYSPRVKGYSFEPAQ